MRQIRKQPFAWQEKSVLRQLRKQFKGAQLVKLRCLYGALTEIDSDFNGGEIKFYTKTVCTYSGLHKDWIPSGLIILQELGIIEITAITEKGRFGGKTLTFLGGNADKTVPGKTGNGLTGNGETGTLEHNTLKEHNISKKKQRVKSQLDILYKWQDEKVVDIWEEFLWWRAFKKRSPMSRRAEKTGLKLIDTLCGGSPSVAFDIINQSLFRGWTTFYELKTGYNGAEQNAKGGNKVANALENFSNG